MPSGRLGCATHDLGESHLDPFRAVTEPTLITVGLPSGATVEVYTVPANATGDGPRPARRFRLWCREMK